ncbi:Aste57867_2662 [Aphanomyces stellatus]|uniref:Aste57867_2662 protein n=1 Tax=Aphanomyces stellatus TaxID=120398 RepID=A0A485KD91_9STRA|nr:hypothetical protein As57867_002655 [Aphanomyces stellatus]VFT79856.1 Aste57867_2662 [Aphanomyces stellatus]
MFLRAVPFVVAKLGRPAVAGVPRAMFKTNLVRPRPFSTLPPPTTGGAAGPTSSTAAVEAPKASNKFKELWNKYGWVGVGTYLSVYVTTLGTMFVAIETGLLSTGPAAASADGGDDKEDEGFNIVTATNSLTEWTKSVGLGAHFNVPEVSPTTGTFLIAWVATKFTEPIRLAVTLMITPRLARYLKAARKP